MRRETKSSLDLCPAVPENATGLAYYYFVGYEDASWITTSDRNEFCKEFIDLG